MSRKHKNSSWNPPRLLIIVLGAGGFMGITSWELGVSLVGSMLIFIAFIETGVILAGFSAFQLRQTVEKTREE
jgi:hypothetical protein